MDLLLLGLSHRTASVDDRGVAAAYVGADAEAWLTRAREAARLAEVAVVATCHRLEVYAVASDPPAAEARLRHLFDDAHAERMYARTSAGAALHLARVHARALRYRKPQSATEFGPYPSATPPLATISLRIAIRGRS